MIKETLTVFSKPSHSKEFLMFSAHVGGAARQQGPRRSAEPQGAIFRRLSLDAWSVEAILSKEDNTHCPCSFHNNRWLVQSCQTTPCIFLLLSLCECVLSRICLWDFGRVVVGCVVSCVAFSSSWQWALIYERGARKWMSSWEEVWVINRHITYPIMMSSTFAPASYSVNSKSAANKSLCLENFVHAKRTKLKQSSKRYFRTIKYSLLK